MAIASHYSQVLSILPAEGLKLSAVLKLLAEMILGGVPHYRPKRENELPLVRLVNHRTATEFDGWILCGLPVRAAEDGIWVVQSRNHHEHKLSSSAIGL